MSDLGFIVGSAFSNLELEIMSRSPTKTPFGVPSSPVLEVVIDDCRVPCILRHGENAQIPPHMINYRANLWALWEHGVRQCLGLSAVGTMDQGFAPGELAVPEQIIDYTWGRDHTFSDGNTELKHVDFTSPFDDSFRASILEAAKVSDCLIRGGVYGVTQGPRLETASEIDRLERDGCTMVGMTGMPEAGLAREIGMKYAICAMAVNYAAGRGNEGASIHDQFKQYIPQAVQQLLKLLSCLIPNLYKNY
ncbi:MAG: 5'-methylthioadenosine phosphorylase [Gammaproteobacteria bacterium]|jgi:5'-methylthioinosine phosphorylase|nr:5'-methylthioadenosine phosphorylase [Gammaproteobacteria bacterium]|tara:strand:+ start:1128 stop:1874 length:747 start_codon:yes stop_codon:yes gene_type:complete